LNQLKIQNISLQKQRQLHTNYETGSQRSNMKAAISQSIAYSYSLLVHPTIRSDQNVTIVSLYKAPPRNTKLEPVLHHYNTCLLKLRYPRHISTWDTGRNTCECRHQVKCPHAQHRKSELPLWFQLRWSAQGLQAEAGTNSSCHKSFGSRLFCYHVTWRGKKSNNTERKKKKIAAT
jgi:hypothetical protein